ncbi:MAG: DUF3078 domain-containing protein [Muribaculum sp.]|nr:DUF3078 domain-containing protein [Muribaculaceae bacterium]MCM1081654.1 DUF3078 domain-containing protein [Muribaculum sp.]
MTQFSQIFAAFSLFSLVIFSAGAQNPDKSLLNLLSGTSEESPESVYITDDDEDEEEPIVLLDLLSDSIVATDTIPSHIPLNFMEAGELPEIAFMPVVFDGFFDLDTVRIDDPTPFVHSDIPELDWIKKLNRQMRQYRMLKQEYVLRNMDDVKLNVNSMPKPPTKYKAEVELDPEKLQLANTEVVVDKTTAVAGNGLPEIKTRNWLHTFNSSVQFSQAYISPNWYQGGNNAVNILGNAIWNVKLNQKLHPNYLVESNIAYKVGVTSAPQDTEHDYLISEDLFQFNGTLGMHAFRRWYYSMNSTFKTQLFNNYPPNSRTKRAAFMSPGELNIGLGMTYNLVDNVRRFRLDASISPLSYNLKVSTNPGVNKASFGIKEGHHSVSEIGSNAEVKISWTIMWNISYNSRFFVFTDYEYIMGDWENTLNLSINRYLSTQLYFHVRYDSSKPSPKNSNWGKWQLKEILSFGLQYQFKTA